MFLHVVVVVIVVGVGVVNVVNKKRQLRVLWSSCCLLRQQEEVSYKL
jgi:hypothetical protein